MTRYSFLSKEHISVIGMQWKRFQARLPVDRDTVRPMIMDSWERCYSRNLPSSSLALCPIDAPALEKAIALNQNLVECSKLVMDKLAHSIHLSKSVVTLIDTTGLVLYASATSQDLKKVPYGIPGRRCDEVTIGTNGMGLCIIEKKAVHVIASEHYNSSLHYLSCSAAPIHDPDGQLVGAINLAINTNNFHQHTLGLVEAAANSIEEHLRLRSLVRNQKVILEQLDEGVIVLGCDEVITSINPKACSMLGLNSQPVGEKIGTYVKHDKLMQSILSDRISFQDREVSFNIHNGRLSCLLSCAAFGESGIILTLREVKRMRNYASRVAGAKAVYSFKNIAGNSNALQETLRLTRVASKSEATTLLVGESGTGKELFAQAIHNAGSRRDGPFVVVNCGALPRNLVQSELFGYEAGAFSGALKEGCPGKFELAGGGTLFLDEIGEMPLEAQVSLLRLLQESEVTRLGGKKPKRINVRIIAATNKDLPGAVRNKSFREDLYYRLNVLTINIPPLRQRNGDVELLTRLFLDKFTATLNKPPLWLSREAMTALNDYHWPGNIRELENCIERLVNVAQKNCVEVDDLPRDIIAGTKPKTLTASHGEKISLKSVQKELILKTLHDTHGNLRQASSLLNISRTTLYAKLKKYCIEIDTFRSL